jgi:hypothetical protein
VSLALLHSGLKHSDTEGKRAVDIAWLVDADTASILHMADFESSQDGAIWV